MPGLAPENDLSRIAVIAHQSLDTVLLRLWPVIFQYSVTETVEGDPRVVYPDFSRIRYLMKKVGGMRAKGDSGVAEPLCWACRLFCSASTFLLLLSSPARSEIIVTVDRNVYCCL